MSAGTVVMVEQTSNGKGEWVFWVFGISRGDDTEVMG